MLSRAGGRLELIEVRIIFARIFFDGDQTHIAQGDISAVSIGQLHVISRDVPVRDVFPKRIYGLARGADAVSSSSGNLCNGN
jgi:hypothetical protein